MVIGVPKESPPPARGLNVHDGRVTHGGGASAMSLPLTPVAEVLCA